MADPNNNHNNIDNNINISRRDFLKLLKTLGISLGLGALGLGFLLNNRNEIFAQFLQNGKEHLIPREERLMLENLIKKHQNQGLGSTENENVRSLSPGGVHTHLLVFTWNAYGLKRYDPNTDPKTHGGYNIEGVIDYIYKQQPAIIFFQELGSKIANKKTKDILEYIIRILSLKGQRWYGAFTNDPRWIFNFIDQVATAILSKYPLRNIKTHIIPFVGIQGNPPGRPPPSILEAVVDIPHWKSMGPITLLATHFPHGILYAEDRILCAKNAVKILNNIPGPVIFGGDFNAHPSTPEMQMIFRTIYDSYSMANVTNVPRSESHTRIDYVLYRPSYLKNFRVLGYEADWSKEAEPFSDHKIQKVSFKAV